MIKLKLNFAHVFLIILTMAKWRFGLTLISLLEFNDESDIIT